MNTNENEMLEQNNMENENVVQDQNNVIQSETLENNEQKNRNNFKILIIVFGILLVLALGAVLAFSMFKSDEQKFYDLLFKKQAIASLVNDIKDGQVDTSFEVDLKEVANAFDGELEEDLSLGMDISQVFKENDTSGKIGIIFNDEELINLEYAKTGDLYALRVEDTNEKYIGIKNENLQEVFEKFGVENADELPDKILTQEDFKKVMKLKPADLNKMLDKYIKVLAKGSKGAVKVENEVELEIGAEKVKTKKYTLTLTEETIVNILEPLLTTLKNDKKNFELVLNDVEAVLELMEENNYPVRDMYNISSNDVPTADEVCDVIDELYQNFKENKKEMEIDKENVMLELSVYEYKGQTVATEISNDEIRTIFMSLVDKDVFIGIVFEEDGEIESKFAFEGNKKNDKLELDCIMLDDEREVKLFTIKEEKSNSTKKIEKLNDENTLIINDATEEEVAEYAQEFAEGIEKIAENLQEKLPMDEFMNDMSNITEMPDEDDEWETLDYIYENPQVEGVLADAQSMYNKISIGDSRADVVAKVGQPTESSVYSDSEFLDWNSNLVNDMVAVSVHIYDGKVCEKTIELFSDKYEGVYLGKESNATIEDLNDATKNIKEGMTYQEVENILGKPAFESRKNDSGYLEYTWTDKMEQSVGITFDKNGKLFLIGFIW